MFVKTVKGELIAMEHIKRIYVYPDPEITQLAKKYELRAQGPSTGSIEIYDLYTIAEGGLEDVQKAQKAFESKVSTVLEYIPKDHAWRTI